MKGFSGPNLSQEEEAFNVQLSAIRVKVEHTFGHFKARWRILVKWSDVHHSLMPTVGAACCVIHIMWEKEKQHCPPAYLDPPVNPQPQSPHKPYNDQPNGEAQEIRNALVRHVANSLCLATP